MIKAIIFDCFGVLVGKGFWDVYAAAGGDPIKDDAFIEGILQRESSGTISNEEFSSTIARQLGISVEEYREVVDREEQPNLPLFDYIRNELKPKYKIALVSNANRGVIERKIPADLRTVFDVEIISAEVGLQKPNPKIFEMVVRRLGVEYGETIFVDDLPKYLTPAAELGIKTIQYVEFKSFKSLLEELLK